MRFLPLQARGEASRRVADSLGFLPDALNRSAEDGVQRECSMVDQSPDLVQIQALQIDQLAVENIDSGRRPL
ncbi:hypothetical protein SAMN05443668_102485 [Cryptosporangium aurantiacum]|uniref:Uncharacterized protein n=1 Tax=Cryptosporangium aurantiacum TaxID=134849 RepID=A0A1M7N8L0_9ACTN|nr:hypothetical protein SAMN05443668_102485 [Cryptosporangium aurantiacum]